MGRVDTRVCLRSNLAFQQEQQQVAAEAASTAEVVGTAVAEIPQQKRNRSSESSYHCHLFSNFERQNLPPSYWPQVDTQG